GGLTRRGPMMPVRERQGIRQISLLAVMWLTSIGMAARAAVGAARANYLADTIAELRQQWQSNRTVTIVCHGHSVPAGYLKTPVVDTLSAYPHLWLLQWFLP